MMLTHESWPEVERLFNAALERAQAVAAALRAAGIPADKIQAEAAPAGDSGPIDRVEIQLMP